VSLRHIAVRALSTTSGALLLCLAVVSVQAREIFPDAAYGNTEGCRYSNTGEPSDSDDFFLLNNEGVATAASFCAFSGPAKKTSTGYARRVICEEEGEKTPEDVMHFDLSSEGYTIRFGDDISWGPLARCR
jgi:hypothetical protein